MNSQEQELIPVTAVQVGDENRMAFLPTYFGPRLMMHGEGLVYRWMRRLSGGYNGGFWNFYELTNGGFYMAPEVGLLQVEVAGNYFSGEMSADAAGIVATLFALGQLAEETQGMDECDTLIDCYHWLREYAGTHAEAARIYRAID